MAKRKNEDELKQHQELRQYRVERLHEDKAEDNSKILGSRKLRFVNRDNYL